MIRTLKAGEEIPSGEPRFYRSSHGYIRARWKVGKGEYVETYVHRIVSGVVQGEHVHHVDHHKDNNDPTNLVAMSPQDHERQHHPRGSLPDEALWLYQRGWSPAKLGQRYHLAGYTVYRYLRDAGVPMRSYHAGNRVRVDADLIRNWHSEGVRAQEMAKRLGLRSSEPVRRAMLELGLPSFPSGRPRIQQQS